MILKILYRIYLWRKYQKKRILNLLHSEETRQYYDNFKAKEISENDIIEFPLTLNEVKNIYQ